MWGNNASEVIIKAHFSSGLDLQGDIGGLALLFVDFYVGVPLSSVLIALFSSHTHGYDTYHMKNYFVRGMMVIKINVGGFTAIRTIPAI